MTKSEIIKTAALLTAIEYVSAPQHGDWYLFPVSMDDKPAKHGTFRKLALAKVSRDDLLEVLKTERCLGTGWLKIHENVLKVAKIRLQTLRSTFGDRIVLIPFEGGKYHKYVDLPMDPSPCAGPRARTFEKLACKAVGTTWCGALRNVQIDGVTKFVDETGETVKIRYEVKGYMGRLTAFVPSAVDKDPKTND